MRYVMKFGGSCMKNGENIRRSAEIVKQYREKGGEIVTITSAMSRVTDEILDALKKAEDGREGEIEEFIGKLAEKHEEACREAINDSQLREETWKEEEAEINELRKLLSVIAYLREVTPRVRDYALSFGERLSTRIFWGSLLDLGIRAEYLRGWEAGIVTNENFGSARPLMTVTYREVKKRLTPLLEKGIVPVVTGFIAATPEGVVTTLGRGGSDYSATIIGAALGVDEIILWKDVEGVMTADPKLVPDARTVPRMSYEEVVELAYFGAQVIHPLALEPASRENIPIRVKSVFNPSAEGTLITKIAEGPTVKALTMIKNSAIILVGGAEAAEPSMIAPKVLSLMHELGIRVLMLSQASSQANISIAIPKDDLDRALKAIRSGFAPGEVQIDHEEGICVIAVIGSGMRGKPGVAAKIFNAVAEKGINVRMIAQGSSELNISFAVREEDGVKALRSLHEEFRLNA
ncbi:MAG: aspartate kinase [Thaumarchaeota archaeon]|nr:aspartate kinase [Nitrososphaerota archaeon]